MTDAQLLDLDFAIDDAASECDNPAARAIEIREWLGAFPDDLKRRIVSLILEQRIDIMAWNSPISLFVNCNDLFDWACADLEIVEVADLTDIEQAIADSPRFGHLLWACRKRNLRPQQLFRELLTPTERALFDAAGPERCHE